MVQIDGVILAGGKSSRMNGNYKGNLIYDNETFVEKIISELGKMTKQIWISYGEEMHDSYEGCRIVQDEYPGCGPLSGLHAGLKKCDSEFALVAACDMPFLQIELYQYLFRFLEAQYDGVVPIIEGKMHPLAAIYRTNIAVSLEEELKKKHFKMQKVCRQLNLRYVDVSDSESYRQMLTNINTVEEYIEVIKGKERGRQR